MQVPVGFAALWLIAGLSAIWIFYVAWRDAYQDVPDTDPVLVGSDLDATVPPCGCPDCLADDFDIAFLAEHQICGWSN